MMRKDDHIAELQKTIRFQRKIIIRREDELKEAKDGIKELDKEIELYRKFIRDQPIPITYSTFDPKKYASVKQLIYNEAVQVTIEEGTWWHWMNIYERLHKKHPQIPLNPETVRRRCQEAAESTINFLRRVKPGYFIWKGGGESSSS